MNRLLVCVLFALLPFAVTAQDSRKAISNADVVSMTKAGLREQTIVLAIEQGPTAFDTSPQELVTLKKAGVTDAVLNAMLAASKNSPGTAVADNHSPGTPTALKLIERALIAVAPMDKLTSINATRQLSTTTYNRSGSTATSEVERIAVYPDRLYVELHSAAIPIAKIVLTPQFSYASNGQRRDDVPAAMAEDYRTGMKFAVAYVAQHMSEFTFTYNGQETLDAGKCDRLRIKHRDGKEQVWSIDQSGLIWRRVAWPSSGEVTTDFSDFRLVDGVNIAFHDRSTGSNGITETTLKLFQVNPPRYEINTALFDPPSNQSSKASSSTLGPSPGGGLRIRVLEEKSVPYVQKLGGGPETSCNISGGSNTTMSASTIGNYTYGNANTATDLHMNCSSYDTTINWPHVLNVMLVEASDGNAYMIACDRAWRWSKCVPLRAGDTFNARRTSQGIAVQAFSTKGHESEPTYSVLQSKVLH